MMTVQSLINILSEAKNKDAVVCLSVDDYEYAMISEHFYDDSQDIDEDGVIGNFLLHLDKTSHISLVLHGFMNSDY